jgi:hypothetical protein
LDDLLTSTLAPGAFRLELVLQRLLDPLEIGDVLYLDQPVGTGFSYG